MTTLKTRIAAGEATIGCWLSAASPLIAEAMASCGFDWLALDMEHAQPDLTDAPALFAAAERGGAVPLARLPSADPYLARRLLDQGAAGVIVPVVEDAAAFGAFLDHCLYPPRGRRGVCLGRCNRWGDDFDAYLREFRPVIVPQIETLAGVEAAAEIAAIAEVDALFLGPYDLSASLGRPGDFSTPEFAAAIAKVRAVCAASGKAAGIHQVKPDAAELKARLDEGFRFVAYGTDIIALRHALAGVRDLTRQTGTRP